MYLLDKCWKFTWNACRSSKKATILNLSENERSSVIGWLQSCDQQPVFVEGVKSPRAFVGSQSPLKIFGLRQLKRHCRVTIVVNILIVSRYEVLANWYFHKCVSRILSTEGCLPQCILGYTPPWADLSPQAWHPPGQNPTKVLVIPLVTYPLTNASWDTHTPLPYSSGN